MTIYYLNLHWYHGAGAAVVLLLLLLSILFAGKYRTAWLTALSALFIVAVAAFWIRNWNGAENLAVYLNSVSPSSGLTKYGFVCRPDGSSIRFTFFHSIFKFPSPAETDAYFFEWRGPFKRSPFMLTASSSGTTAREVLGFGFAWTKSGLPSSLSVRQLQLMFPNWFILMCLLVFPARWFYMHKRGRNADPRKYNLCTQCNYCLNGLPEPVRCPECGTPREATSIDPHLDQDRGRI